MRGKNIIWLSLVTMLLASLMVGIGSAPSHAKLSIDPSVIPKPPAQGLPGMSFDMTVKMENVHDLWVIGFIVQYNPYAKPLAAGFVLEGDFMKQGDYKTSFTYKIDVFKGQLKISITRLLKPGEPPVGASGDGVLATFTFSVVEAGDSDIEFIDVYMYDSNLDEIPFSTFGGYYDGETANLISMKIQPDPKVNVGDTLVFNTSCKSFADVPLQVRTRLDIERLEDGRRITLYSNQTYVKGGLGEPPEVKYLYVNEYNEWLEWDWSWPKEDVFGPIDGNYIYSDGGPYADAATSRYGFDDISLLPGESILDVLLQAYTKADSMDIDADPYGHCAGTGWLWIDSLWGGATWAWHVGRYYPPGYALDVQLPEVYTQDGINSFELLLFYWTPTGASMGDICFDSIRLRVEVSPLVILGTPNWQWLYPGESLELPPITWNAVEGHEGTYVVTATLEYTLTGGVTFMEGAKTQTRTFVIEP